MGFIKSIVKRTPLQSMLETRQMKKALAEWTDHDEQMKHFYGNYIKSGDLVFDVGANIGNRSKIFLALGATVVAVEPQERCLRVLSAAFSENPQFTLIKKVLGASEGSAEMMMSNEHVISSLSTDWVKAVKESGRFSNGSWDQTVTVPMTTLDALIAAHGAPVFMKVDVEGFEHEVLKGLSCPLTMLSLEFTPEFIESTLECIDKLGSLGNVEYNYSLGESMSMELDTFISAEKMRDILESFRGDTVLFGDIYCQFVS